MAELGKGFMVAVKKLLDAKIPLAAQLKDTNAFVQNLDKAQELNEELIEVSKKKEALKKYIEAIKKKADEYDKVLLQLEKATKGNDDAQPGITALKGSLNQIDGYTKAPLGLK